MVDRLQFIFKTIVDRWLLLLAFTALSLVIIYTNTIVHPYLLADNRHYTFYIWNRFFGRHEAARYIIVPVYMVGLVAAHNAICTNKTAGFQLCFWICSIVGIAFQPMIELRYFFIPFVLMRLHSVPLTKLSVAIELAMFSMLNAAYFIVFMTKEIYWDNFEHVQRLIW